MMMVSTRWMIGLALAACVLNGTYSTERSWAADDERVIEVGRGRISLQAPESWKRVKPQNRIIEHEFTAPAAEGDPADARITVMGAGGGVEANIERWVDQFVPAAGDEKDEQVKKEKSEREGAEVHVVSIVGTYKDRPGGGPFTNTPVVERENYRMLSAISATADKGQYFIKMYGPKSTVDANEEAFREMLETLKIQ